MTDVENKPKILIVEDQLVEAMNTSRLLKSFEMNVMGIANNFEQIEPLLDEDCPDLILMDINLGGVESGIDAARSLIKDHNIPIVFTTAYTDERTISNAISISPYGYLIKPFGEISLKTAVQIALERKRIEQDLVSSNKRLTLASEVAKLSILEVDKISHSVVIKSVENLFDFPRTMSLDDFIALFSNQDLTELQLAIANKQQFRSVLQLDLEDRELQWYQVVLSDVTLSKDKVQVGAIQDVTELRNTQSSLGIADKIVSEIKEGILVYDHTGTVMKVNNAFCEMIDKHEDRIISHHINSVFPLSRKQDNRPNYLVDGLRTDITIVNQYGVRKHIVMSISSFSTEETRNYFVAILTDVTELKSSESQLKYLAFTDALTGAGNRNYLSRIVEEFTESFEPCSIIFIDIDEFKLINDTHGHEVGDEILRGCVSRFKTAIREEDTIIRFGGDEFVVVTKTTCSEEISIITERITNVFSRSFSTSSGAFQISASIGVATATESMSATDLLKNADIAMYSAKQIGKNNIVRFHEGLSKDIEYRLFIQQGLGSAIENKQITAFFQPIVSADGSVLSVEALARWHLPDKGTIRPDKFIPIAERTKYIHEVGRLMLEEVSMALKTLEQWGFNEIKINLNMSAVQLQNESVTDIFEECITIHNIQPQKLVLEITESTLQSTKARKSLSALKSLGVTISIDDFGTGFSCISELANETYDAIKLDRSLLPDFPLHDDTSKRRALIIKNVVELCRYLDMPCTIEGLETEEQVEFAKEIGATAMQGYRFARPLSLLGLMEYLQENHAATVVKTAKL